MNISEKLHEALSNYSKRELIDVLAHLIKVYVIEGGISIKKDTELESLPKSLWGLTFAQLILRMQLEMDIPELHQFRVDGEEVYLLLNNKEYSVTTGNVVGEEGLSESEIQVVSEQIEPKAEERKAAEPEKKGKCLPKSKPDEFSEDVEISDRFKLLEFD